MFNSIATILLLLIPATILAGDLMQGKHETDHTIRLTSIVSASPEQVFQLWSTEEGVTKFFAPKARIGKRAGDPYEMIFEPEMDPDGSSFGTKGARLLKIEENHLLAFEWITFVATRDADTGPPYMPPEERNANPLPTWVEIEIEPLHSDSSKTEVRLTHYGFRSGGKWDASFVYFQKGWARVLQRMEEYCRTKKKSADL